MLYNWIEYFMRGASMMIIALTGLHGAGKSYFANNIIAKYGFTICSKKDLIRYICKEKTNRDDFGEWYKEEFDKDADNITKTILSYLNLNKNIVLDAVHSDLEWKIITSVVPDAELIGIITPEFIRKTRREEGDVEKDQRRIRYWHNGGGCLMTELSWTFNGGASLEINEKLFKEFLMYVRNKRLAINGNDINFSESKTDRLSRLIEENSKLENKIKNANEIIEEYKNKRVIITTEEER